MNQSAVDSATERTDRRFGLSTRARERLLALGFVVLWLLFWEFSILSGLLDARFFMPPSTILVTGLSIWLSDNLWVHVSFSVQRLIIGYVLGIVPALFLGGLIGRSYWLRAGCGPVLIILASFPALAIYPIVMVIFGLGEWSKWIVVAVSAFFMMLYWTRISVAGRLDVGRDVAAGAVGEVLSTAFTTRRGRLTLLFLGLKLAAWVALLTLIPAEFVGAKSGVGYVIWDSWARFNVGKMYVGIALAGALGALAWLAVDLVERLVLAIGARRGRDLTPPAPLP
jgi:NitT/TauT family transport system permease protein